jgi:hypothetical protein
MIFFSLAATGFPKRKRSLRMVGDFFQSSLASLDSQKDPGDIAGGIGEDGQLRAARHFGWRQNRLAAEFLHFIQRCLKVVDLGVPETRLAPSWLAPTPPLMPPGPPPVSTTPYFIGLLLSIFHPNNSP